MYRILYNDSIIFDPYGNDNEVVTDASMSVEINAAAYMDFTMSRNHPLYNTIAERDGVVTLYWDGDILFQGVIESIDMDINGNKSISCVSALDYLNDTVVRPYSTIAGEQELTAPSSVNGYFQWLIDQHNKHVLDSRKQFDVGVNQGAYLQWNNFIYRSSTNNPTTASEISDQLLGTLGGYLIMKYVDGRYVLDLYSSLNTVNSQIIDFGVNITDFSKTIDTKDQYTALILKGGSPEFDGGSFESGDWSHWITHPNEPLVEDKTHGGYLSSFFVSGIGEYVNDSSFYFRRGRRYRATVYVKNERESDVTIHGSYQYEQSGMWTTVDSGTSLVVKNEGDNWTEFTFDFMPDISEYSKIRPRWYFDNVSNDGNRRVYLDDFSFSQVIGDADVSEDPINVSMVPDGGTQYDSNILKTGDVIYDPSSVLRYGYKEEVYEDSTITNVNDLLQAGIKALIKLKSPQISLDIKAVDLSMFMKEYTHLNVGDIVRVRSAIHDIDEYLMVNSINLDLQDPGQSEYSIGKVYDSLTGQQSGIIRSLNSGINSSLDSIVSLDKTTKDQAVQISSTQQAADQAQNTATNAQSTADNAQQMSNANKEAIDSVKSNQTEYENQLKRVQKDLDDQSKDITAVDRRVDNVSSNLASTQSDLAELKTVVSNTTDKADQALQTANSVKTELETNYSTTDEIAEKYSTKNEVASTYLTKSDASNTYLTKSDASNTYATKSMVEQTSQSITSSVEATYATKATVESLENIANNAVQTWMSSGVPTLSNKPASDWTTSELKSQHSGDIYYDSDTGYSYRFGSSDGQNYSWALVKDTDITKAIADAAKAQQTAEEVSDNVTELKTDIRATYATKTEVEQTANGLRTTVTEQASKINQNTTTISQVSQKANSLSSTITQVQGDVDLMQSKGQELVLNGGFENGTTSKWYLRNNLGSIGTDSPHSGKYYLRTTTTDLHQINSDGSLYMIPAIVGHTYRMSCWFRRKQIGSVAPFGGLRLQMSNDGTNASDWKYLNFSRDTVNDFVYEEIEGTVDSSDIKFIHARIAFANPGTWDIDDISIKDVTDLNSVESTANSALSQSSTVQNELASFKTSVQQTYETKTDSLAKQSTINQTIDGFKTTVSQTYTTKTEFNNLQISGGRNIARDTKAFGRNNVTSSDSGWLSAYVDRTNGMYKGCTVRSLTSSDGSRQQVFQYDVYNANPGEYYTLSFWAKGSGKMRLYCHGPSGYIRAARIATSDGQLASASYNDGATDMTLSSEWKRYWIVWLLDGNTPGGYSTTKQFLLRNDNKMTSCDVCGVMIENGNKASEWSPAPEDIEKTYATKSYVDHTYAPKTSKLIWSGNVNKGGNFTCSEAPYYNVFAARLDTDNTLMLGIRSELNSSSGSITLLGTDPTAGSYQGLRTCNLTFSNDTSVAVTDIKVGTDNDSSKPLTELWGIL